MLFFYHFLYELIFKVHIIENRNLKGVSIPKSFYKKNRLTN